MDNFEFKKQISLYCRDLWLKDLQTSNDGNVSIRNGNKIFITPSGVSKRNLNENEIIEVDINDNYDIVSSSGLYSSEILIHLACYKNRDDVNAVIHSHPPYSTAYSVIGKGLEIPILANIVIKFGQIPLVKYAKPSTQELADEIVKYIVNGYNCLILENHGILTIGTNIEKAFLNTESLESFAKTQYIAESIGVLKCLSKNNINDNLMLRNEFGLKGGAVNLHPFLCSCQNPFLRKLGFMIKKIRNA